MLIPSLTKNRPPTHTYMQHPHFLLKDDGSYVSSPVYHPTNPPVANPKTYPFQCKRIQLSSRRAESPKSKPALQVEMQNIQTKSNRNPKDDLL